MRSLFVSDLHLIQDRPEANERFFGFLEGAARGADALYILGDFFEYWIGDDDLADPFNAVVAASLRDLTRAGTALHLMHGNRDFLLGERFCKATGGDLLEDPCAITLAGESVLLMHGDTLCTDDHDYQSWRAIARSAAWQKEFLAKSIPERRKAVMGLREKSKEVVGAKPADIMDVNAGAVEEAFRRHGVRRLIHGHTHRPSKHVLKVDGRACERWVLPDWYGRGGYLAVEDGKPRLTRF